MKKTVVKILQKIGIFLLCLVFAVGWILLNFWAEKPAKGTISASAEEMTTTETTETEVEEFDFSAYPSMNTFPYPYTQTSYNQDGVELTVNSDGTINAVGTATADFEIELFYSETVNPLRYNQRYRCTVENLPNSYAYVVFRVFVDNVWYEPISSGAGAQVYAGTSDVPLKVVLRVYTGCSFAEGTILKPMLTIGYTIYDFTPSYYVGYSAGNNDGYENGFDEGYEAGNADGYENGYDEGYEAGMDSGMDKALGGIFYGSTYSVTLEKAYTDDSQSSTTEYSLLSQSTDDLLIVGGLNFKNLTKKLENLAIYGWEGTSIEVTFYNPVSVSLFTLLGRGQTTSFYSCPIITSTENKTYECEWSETENGYLLCLPATIKMSENIMISKMSFWWGGGSDGVDLNIVSTTTDYYTGYAHGYDVGYGDGDLQGSNSGYSRGYEKGFAAALASIGDSDLAQSIRSFVYSVFEAPFAAIKPVLSLEVAGLDLSGIFGFVLFAVLLFFVMRLL